MSEYLYLYRGGMDSNTPPQQMQEQMEKWGAWLKDLGQKGVLKNPGQPLDKSGKVVRGSNKTVVDGPFAEAKDLVGGFSIVEAKDLNHAAELARGCPVFNVGGSVEVRPVMKVDL
jgi:hypothetical protein